MYTQVLHSCVPVMHRVECSKCATVCAYSCMLGPLSLLSALAATCEMLLVVAAGSIHLYCAHTATLTAGNTCEACVVQPYRVA
jgi:hypothetical protein